MRADGWADRLMTLLAAEMATTYEPGRHDCFTLACHVVEALTGARPYGDVRYATDAGALKALRKRGFERLGEAMAAILVERPQGHAQRGDIAVIETDTLARDTLGIVMDGLVLVRIGHEFQRRPLGDARLILAVE